MKRCCAPCSGNISETEYNELIREALVFLKGSFSEVKRSLTKKMNEASEKMMYEAAAVYRDRIRVLANLWQKQKVVSSPDTEYDVFGIWKDEMYTAAVSYTHLDVYKRQVYGEVSDYISSSAQKLYAVRVNTYGKEYQEDGKLSLIHIYAGIIDPAIFFIDVIQSYSL